MYRTVLAGALGAAVLWGGVSHASDAPASFPEFTAKRVKPPAAGTARRITVQIEPKPPEPARPEPEPETEMTEAAPAEIPEIGKYSWFWSKVSPDMTAATPGRLDDALQALAASGQVSAPRLQTLQDIARASGVSILKSTVGTKVSPALVLAVIAVESSGKAEAVSSAGAAGLMQLMPDTATRFGVTDRMQPEQSIAGGVRYLDWLMSEFGDDPILVLAGYNAGEGAVRSHFGVPPYPETRDYVPKVLAAFQVARGLWLTPPELISDGCVFTAMN